MVFQMEELMKELLSKCILHTTSLKEQKKNYMVRKPRKSTGLLLEKLWVNNMEQLPDGFEERPRLSAIRKLTRLISELEKSAIKPVDYKAVSALLYELTIKNRVDEVNQGWVRNLRDIVEKTDYYNQNPEAKKGLSSAVALLERAYNI